MTNTAASDNPFPSVLFAEHVDPANPGAGTQRLFVDTDHLLKLRDSAGTVTTLGQGMTNPMTTAGDMIYGGSSGTPTRLAGGTLTYVLTSNGATSAPSWQAAPGGGVTHTVVSNALGSDVSLSTANTYFTGPSVTLSAGTWLLFGGVTIDGFGGSATNGTAKLWDGTTVIASGQAMLYGGGAWDNAHIHLSGTVVIASGTPAWKISVASDATTSAFVRAATQNNAAGNTASYLTAVKIA